MRISQAVFTTVTVPEADREDCAQVSRDGVTDVIDDLTNDVRLLGCGDERRSNVDLVLDISRACRPILTRRNPRSREAILRMDSLKPRWRSEAACRGRERARGSGFAHRMSNDEPSRRL